LQASVKGCLLTTISGQYHQWQALYLLTDQVLLISLVIHSMDEFDDLGVTGKQVEHGLAVEVNHEMMELHVLLDD